MHGVGKPRSTGGSSITVYIPHPIEQLRHMWRIAQSRRRTRRIISAGIVDVGTIESCDLEAEPQKAHGPRLLLLTLGSSTIRRVG